MISRQTVPKSWTVIRDCTIICFRIRGRLHRTGPGVGQRGSSCAHVSVCVRAYIRARICVRTGHVARPQFRQPPVTNTNVLSSTIATSHFEHGKHQVRCACTQAWTKCVARARVHVHACARSCSSIGGRPSILISRRNKYQRISLLDSYNPPHNPQLQSNVHLSHPSH